MWTRVSGTQCGHSVRHLLCSQPQHLNHYLARPEGWDLLVGHYLGLDHAGHSRGVASSGMAQKLAQMDKEVEEVASEWGPRSGQVSSTATGAHSCATAFAPSPSQAPSLGLRLQARGRGQVPLL